jgi:hypothetical protein
MHKLLLCVFAASAAFGADPPYAGQWKINVAKSDLGQTTVTYTDEGSGQMQVKALGMSYTFTTDGKERPAMPGQTAAWKQIDRSTWLSINKVNGLDNGTDTLKVSADGKTLTMVTKGTKPSGTPIDTTTVFERVSGGPGLAGVWRTKNAKSNAPNIMEVAASGADGLLIKFPDLKTTIDAKFDGKQYPVTGPAVPANLWMTIERAGVNGFDMTETQSGKVFYKYSYRVSSDGKTLTEIGGAVAINEKVKILFDRQ